MQRITTATTKAGVISAKTFCLKLTVITEYWCTLSKTSVICCALELVAGN